MRPIALLVGEYVGAAHQLFPETCPECGGRGTVWHADMITCEITELPRRQIDLARISLLFVRQTPCYAQWQFHRNGWYTSEHNARVYFLMFAAFVQYYSFPVACKGCGWLPGSRSDGVLRCLECHGRCTIRPPLHPYQDRYNEDMPVYALNAVLSSSSSSTSAAASATDTTEPRIWAVLRLRFSAHDSSLKSADASVVVTDTGLNCGSTLAPNTDTRALDAPAAAPTTTAYPNAPAGIIHGTSVSILLCLTRFGFSVLSILPLWFAGTVRLASGSTVVEWLSVSTSAAKKETTPDTKLVRLPGDLPVLSDRFCEVTWQPVAAAPFRPFSSHRYEVCMRGLYIDRTELRPIVFSFGVPPAFTMTAASSTLPASTNSSDSRLPGLSSQQSGMAS